MDETVTGVPGVFLGRIAGRAIDGRPLEWRESGPPRGARVVWLPFTPDWNDLEGARVVLGFEDGNERRPVILGLLDTPPSQKAVAPAALDHAGGPIPENVKIEGRDEVVIECGKAKIALRADGRIVIRGGYLVSRSSGPVKIKGASVAIN